MNFYEMNIITYWISFFWDVIFLNVFFLVALFFLTNLFLLLFLWIIVRRRKRLATKILNLIESDLMHSSIIGQFILKSAKSIIIFTNNFKIESLIEQKNDSIWDFGLVFLSKIFSTLEKTQLIIKSKIFFRFK